MANEPTKQAQTQAPVKEADPKAAPQAKQPEPAPTPTPTPTPTPAPEEAPAPVKEAPRVKASNTFPREFVLVSGKHRLPNGEVLTAGARVTLSEIAYRNLADKFRELNVNE